MQKLFCIVALTLFVGTAAQARLGETLEQCEARYGTSVYDGLLSVETFGQPADIHRFWKNGYEITVYFLHATDAAIHVSFTRRDEAAMSDDEIASLMKTESKSEDPWAQVTQSYDSDPKWTRHDGAQVTYSSEGKLSFDTKQCLSFRTKGL